MDALVNIFYVEGNLLLTGCKIIALMIALEFFVTIVWYLSKMGR